MPLRLALSEIPKVPCLLCTVHQYLHVTYLPGRALASLACLNALDILLGTIHIIVHDQANSSCSIISSRLLLYLLPRLWNLEVILSPYTRLPLSLV